MESKNLALILDAITNQAMQDWEQAIEGLTPSDLSMLNSLACALSTTAAEFSEYVDYRGGMGCGDHGHEDALKAAQKMRKRVRKALGYSYP